MDLAVTVSLLGFGTWTHVGSTASFGTLQCVSSSLDYFLAHWTSTFTPWDGEPRPDLYCTSNCQHVEYVTRAQNHARLRERQSLLLPRLHYYVLHGLLRGVLVNVETIVETSANCLLALLIAHMIIVYQLQDVSHHEVVREKSKELVARRSSLVGHASSSSGKSATLIRGSIPTSSTSSLNQSSGVLARSYRTITDMKTSGLPGNVKEQSTCLTTERRGLTSEPREFDDIDLKETEIERSTRQARMFPCEQSPTCTSAGFKASFFSDQYERSKYMQGLALDVYHADEDENLVPQLEPKYDEPGDFRGDRDELTPTYDQLVKRNLTNDTDDTWSIQNLSSRTENSKIGFSQLNRETGTLSDTSTSQQGHKHLQSSMIDKESRKCVENAQRIVVVNIVGVDGLELPCSSEVFGLKQLSGKGGFQGGPSSSGTGLQLTQVLGCVGKFNDWKWIGSSSAVKGEAMEVIVSNSSIAPLVLVVPMDEVVSQGAVPLSPWIIELRKLLVPVHASRRPVVLLGICKNNYQDRVLKHAMVNVLGIHTDYTFWLVDSSDSSVMSSCYGDILGIIDKSTSPSVLPLLQAEKLAFLERCCETEKIPATKLLYHFSQGHEIGVAQFPGLTHHLQSLGLVISSCTCLNSDVIAMDKTEDRGESMTMRSNITAACSISSGTGHKNGDDCQVVLQPSTFFDQVTKLIDVFKLAHAEENGCLVPSARHGLIPKHKISPVPAVSLPSVLPALHRAGIVLDPLLVGCKCTDCAEEAIVFQKDSSAGRAGSRHKCPGDNARHCYLVPSCLKEGSHLSALVGYHGITPIAFRSPGCNQENIPLSLFYQLVAYLMKHFPSSVKCSKYAARFHIASLHILEIAYAETHITAIVYVHNKEQSLSTVTPGICARVRTTISTHLDTLSTAAGSLILCPAALIQDSRSQWPDFVDLSDIEQLSETQEWYTIGGQVFVPCNDFFFWFGKAGPEPSEIQKQFSALVERVDPLRAAAWLYERQVICGSDLDQVLSQDVDARSYLLLRLLEGKGAKGSEVIDAILDDPTLKRKNKVLMVATATQTSPAVHGNVTRSSDENQEPKVKTPWVRSEQQVQQSVQPLDGFQHRQLGSGHQVMSRNNYQNTGTDLSNATDKRESSWNQLSHSFNPAATQTQSLLHDTEPFPTDSLGQQTATEKEWMPRAPSSLVHEQIHSSSSLAVATHHQDEHRNRSGIISPPSAAAKGFDSSPMSLPVSLQARQSVTATSSSATYTGLHQQELAFPRSLPTAPQPSMNGAASQHASETVLSALSQKSRQTIKGDPEIHPIFESKYWHVERATDHFNEAPVKEGGRRLGSGSFGTVFQGTLHSEAGQKFEVAVKRLKKASSLNPAQVELSRRQFGTEMNLLTRYLHKNIVRLVGFSSDGPELCLIYEFMQKGALSHRLDCKDNSPALDWRVRLTIARGIASALEFLHTAYRQPVIHRDVKSSNVLLGANFEAKLSDFGLAMVGDADGELQAELALQPSVGTRPYMAPEAFQKIVSTKIDIYSLGMILFELATGLPPYSSKKKQTLKSYLEDIERQRVDMMKMLDPKARWPKGKRWNGRDNTFGLELLDVAKLATTRDHTKRPEILETQCRTLNNRLNYLLKSRSRWPRLQVGHDQQFSSTTSDGTLIN